eukprot:gnl/MRDRNA2_/MRDRNA2_88377_c0_seq1.p1 gnl/MRDRNA2_/MRDRNA2_88377_c0~~gnl/MRDRNA2_/MRDRNA2_88377_c0_seq1.p1  ORF type:complete len:462 (-),score=93.68 gnl/MRDRNA2_/MRDRNA2_88377_c0_seq1:189-1574(-)
MCPRQAAILSLFDDQLMPDTSIIADGKEIRAHKAILVACSGFFKEHFGAGGAERMEVALPYKAVRAMIRFLYFGKITESGLGPEDALDLLISARDWGIDVLTEEDVVDLIVPQLSNTNCLNVILHKELDNRPKIAAGVCEYVGKHFFELLTTPTSKVNLLKIKKTYMLDVIKEICRGCGESKHAETLVNFCLEYSQIDNPCDLLRDCKQWAWNSSDSESKMRDPAGGLVVQSAPSSPKAPPMKADMSEEEIFEALDVNKDGVVSKEEFTQFKKAMNEASYHYVKEWHIPNLKGALGGEPLCQLVAGDLFEWRVRVDGGEGKLRIVYEDVTPKKGQAACCRRFPAATFAWKVKFRGEEIFNDRPVFITFAERVSLHWSTTLNLDASQLTEADELSISVVMTENPLLSLILYFLSANVKDEHYAEDILNRLPHIEYRCLSSFFIFRQASRPPTASLTSTQPAS